jgi:hypothetical protein
MLTLWEEPSLEPLDVTLGSSSPASRGSGMLFRKLASLASTRPASTSTAVGGRRVRRTSQEMSALEV